MEEMHVDDEHLLFSNLTQGILETKKDYQENKYNYSPDPPPIPSRESKPRKDYQEKKYNYSPDPPPIPPKKTNYVSLDWAHSMMRQGCSTGMLKMDISMKDGGAGPSTEQTSGMECRIEKLSIGDPSVMEGGIAGSSTEVDAVIECRILGSSTDVDEVLKCGAAVFSTYTEKAILIEDGGIESSTEESTTVADAVDGYDLASAVMERDITVVTMALQAGADASIVMPRYNNYWNVNLICVAAINGQVDIIEPLKAGGASLKHRTRCDHSALDIAACHGHPQVICKLVELGIDVDASSTTGWTALHWAVFDGQLQCVKQLLELNASIDARTQGQRWTPLMWAAQREQMECIEAMVSKGVDVSATDMNGHNAIDLAWLNGKRKVVDWLQMKTNCRSLIKNLTSAVAMGVQDGVTAALTAGVDASVVLPEYRGSCDMNIISIAAMEGQAEVIDILQRAGARIDHRNANGESALHIAAKCGRSQVITKLLAQGLDVEAVSAYG
ncbi:unnamed protein product, partial [Meganyctiphanes norvegica]